MELTLMEAALTGNLRPQVLECCDNGRWLVANERLEHVLRASGYAEMERRLSQALQGIYEVKFEHVLSPMDRFIDEPHQPLGLTAEAADRRLLLDESFPTSDTPLLCFYRLLFQAEARWAKLRLLQEYETVMWDESVMDRVRCMLRRITCLARILSARKSDEASLSHSVCQLMCHTLTTLYAELSLLFDIQPDADDDRPSWRSLCYLLWNAYPCDAWMAAYDALADVVRSERSLCLGTSADETECLLIHLAGCLPRFSSGSVYLPVCRALESYTYLMRQPYSVIPDFAILQDEGWNHRSFQQTSARLDAAWRQEQDPRAICTAIGHQLQELYWLPVLPVASRSLPSLMRDWLHQQQAVYRSQVGNILLSSETEVKAQPSRANVKLVISKGEMISEALKELKLFEGGGKTGLLIMSKQEFAFLNEVTKKFLDLNYSEAGSGKKQIVELPSISRKITYHDLDQADVFHCFHTIYQQMKGRGMQVRDFALFLQAVFTNFKDTEVETICKSFSRKPKTLHAK